MRPVALVAALLCPSLAWAAWPFGGAVTRIPVPARPFEVEVRDVTGVVLQLTSATLDGEVAVWGELGKAQVSVPFESVDRWVVSAGPDDRHRLLTVTTRAGETVAIAVDDDTPLFGRTSWGLYRIEVADILEVRLTGPGR